jgi:hypothetical protein
MATFSSPDSGTLGAYNSFPTPPVNVSLDNIRRTFDLSSMIAELRPAESPFFTYLTKVRRVPTPDPVFKMLEQRHQWQRRNFHVNTAIASNVGGSGDDLLTDGIKTSCYYDRRGKETGTTETSPYFFVEGQVIAIENVTYYHTDTTVNTGTLYARINDTPTPDSGGEYTLIKVQPLFVLTATAKKQCVGRSTNWDQYTIPDNSRGQVVGSAYQEATGKPEGWWDVMSSTEGYAQIFKTACPLMSGTAMATELRGKKNEFARIWDEKMREHKMDLEHAFLFGVGNVGQTTGALTPLDTTTNNDLRYTWGALPFISLYGNTHPFTYANSGYNDFVDWCGDFFAPEKGNSSTKLVLASRKVIGWFNKLNNGESFLGNTLQASAAQFDVQNVKSQFGFNLTKINTIFGELNFVASSLLRDQWEDYVIVLDLPNIAYRPLVGNGLSRDTFYQTNVQAPDIDGRVDQIVTEAGLQILLPETHAVLKWS